MIDTQHSTEQHHTLWDRIPGEPDRAFRAFEVYLDLPFWERQDLHAYRLYVDNPNAPHVSAAWLGWKERFFWQERTQAYDSYVQKQRRAETIRAQLDAGYELGDELARMEQRMFHLQELAYVKAREKLEVDDLQDYRPMDLINLMRVISEAYTAIKKARSLEKQDPFEESEGLTEEEMGLLFGQKMSPNQRRAAEEEARRALPDPDSEDHNGL